MPTLALGSELLGGKGAGLFQMAAMGLPVPPGFVIDTRVCSLQREADQNMLARLSEKIANGVAHIEHATGKQFGSQTRPLLVSVRSGARESMPGMMDTILNLGVNDDTVVGLANASGDERFAWDSYRRLIQMYSNIVLGLEALLFEQVLEDMKSSAGAASDSDLPAAALRELTSEYKAIFRDRTGFPFPQDPHKQLGPAIDAVFASWNTARACTYRRLNRIPDTWGTAVTVQAMVFGNLGGNSATGVAFTRNPATGERQLFGEYLANAQGEDVVAGIRTPLSLTRGGAKDVDGSDDSLEVTMPGAFQELLTTAEHLERHYGDVQDIEFTIERNILFILQTRSAKRTANAAVKIATDLVREGLIDKREALLSVDPSCVDQLLHPRIAPGAPRVRLAVGLAASPGAAMGKIAFNSDAAQRQAKTESVILVRKETSPDDIEGMHAASGFLTARGGLTSHAAVVARGMGRPCVCGAGTLEIDELKREMTIGRRVLREGDVITIDGSTGDVLLGQMPLLAATPDEQFSTLLEWADELRRMGVRANADTPADCRKAIEFGAEGIGLCRTEHMFFGQTRISAMREMILAESAADRQRPLSKLSEAQREDFIEILTVMDGRPVTIRLLDPPLHEFMPNSDAEFDALAEDSGLDSSMLKDRAAALHEFNPMLGHRGCRLGVTHPEIYEMQCRAIFEAAIEVVRRGLPAPALEVMVPLICTREELLHVRDMVDRVALEVFEKAACSIPYLVGTMIELPRAALLAGEIAEVADFFSFGTNDLTQTTLGLSRDDSHRFLEAYQQRGIFKHDPFVSIDRPGVGRLMEIAVDAGRAVCPLLKVGICGEHAGDPNSIQLCEDLGLSYISASPYRVLTARLAAAQATIRNRGRRTEG